MFNYRFELRGNEEFCKIHVTLFLTDDVFEDSDHPLIPILNTVPGCTLGPIHGRVAKHSITLEVSPVFDRLAVMRDCIPLIEAWSGDIGKEDPRGVILPPRMSSSDYDFAESY